jgi:hypothetical protein
LAYFSFTYHPIEKLHDTIPEILPGIEKMVTIHYNVKQKMLEGILTEKKNKKYTTQALQIDTILPSIQRYIEDNNPFNWYAKTSLPFEIEVQRRNPEINIFSEFENIVLLIRVPDEKEELNDLVFLYLNENPSNFGITNSINPLTTDNKAIIGFLIRRMILNTVNIQRNDKKTLENNNKRTRMIIDKAESMRLEMNRTNDNYGLSLVKLCQQYLSTLAEKNRRKYGLSSSAMEKIKNYKGDIKDLEMIMAESVAYVESLYMEDPGEIEILEWHIQYDNQKSAAEKEIPVIHIDKYSKTLSLLDRLENAALVVKSNNLKLTGTNVGKACNIPISAPAISDALYNHKSKINHLLKLYPDKWITIRKEFRPLNNVMKGDE